jgi:pimeloyl-ACP methyl ester carboxylesterase
MPQVKANGLSFEVESFGRESDPAILLIMGYTAQLTRWPVTLCEGLASRGFRVIRFDNRDVGLSEKLERLGHVSVPEAMAKVMKGEPLAAPYKLHDMAADAVGVLDALNIKQAHIVGASMGGMIAQLIAAHHPAKTRSLVSIMSTTGRPGLPQPGPEVMSVLMTPPKNFERETRIAQAMHAWRVIGSKPPYAADDKELRAQAELDVDRTPYYPQGIARQFVAIMASGPRLEDTLGKIKAPTLVIHGAADPLVLPEGGKDTAATIPGARLKLIENMGHDIPLKLVPTLAREIADFAAEVDATPRA